MTADRFDLTSRPCVRLRYEESEPRAPGVSDCIELDNDHGAILACGKALGHLGVRVWRADVKEGRQTATP